MEFRAMAALQSNSRIWWLPAPLLIFTGRGKDLGIDSEEHLTRWKARKVPHKTKCFQWQGTCWPLARPYLNIGKTCQVSQRDDENGVVRLTIWAGSQPSWASCTILIHIFLTLPCFLGWAVSPLSVVLIHEIPHPSGAQFCMWNEHLLNKRPGSFTGSLKTICRLPLRTTSPLQGTTRTFKACSHLTLEVTPCQGI